MQEIPQNQKSITELKKDLTQQFDNLKELSGSQDTLTQYDRGAFQSFRDKVREDFYSAHVHTQKPVVVTQYKSQAKESPPKTMLFATEVEKKYKNNIQEKPQEFVTILAFILDEYFKEEKNITNQATTDFFAKKGQYSIPFFALKRYFNKDMPLIELSARESGFRIMDSEPNVKDCEAYPFNQYIALPTKDALYYYDHIKKNITKLEFIKGKKLSDFLLPFKKKLVEVNQNCGLLHMTWPPTLDVLEKYTSNQYIISNGKLYFYDFIEKKIQTLDFQEGKNLNSLQITLKKDTKNKLTENQLQSIRSLIKDCNENKVLPSLTDEELNKIHLATEHNPEDPFYQNLLQETTRNQFIMVGYDVLYWSPVFAQNHKIGTLDSEKREFFKKNIIRDTEQNSITCYEDFLFLIGMDEINIRNLYLSESKHTLYPGDKISARKNEDNALQGEWNKFQRAIMAKKEQYEKMVQVNEALTKIQQSVMDIREVILNNLNNLNQQLKKLFPCIEQNVQEAESQLTEIKKSQQALAEHITESHFPRNNNKEIYEAWEKVKSTMQTCETEINKKKKEIAEQEIKKQQEELKNIKKVYYQNKNYNITWLAQLIATFTDENFKTAREQGTRAKSWSLFKPACFSKDPKNHRMDQIKRLREAADAVVQENYVNDQMTDKEKVLLDCVMEIQTTVSKEWNVFKSTLLVNLETALELAGADTNKSNTGINAIKNDKKTYRQLMFKGILNGNGSHDAQSEPATLKKN